MESHVISSIDDGILSLTLNRPEKLNAFTYSIIGELLEQLRLAEEDDTIRAVLITGTDRAFSAGDDIISMGEHPYPLPPGANATREYQQRLMKRWYWYPKSTIAAIRGRCHGIASDVALDLEMELHDVPVEDRAEGRQSFIEKRDPIYKGL